MGRGWRRLPAYSEGIGLDPVDLSRGHDEYLYRVVKDYRPEAALYIHPRHREGEYQYLMNDRDRRTLRTCGRTMTVSSPITSPPRTTGRRGLSAS